MSTTNPNENEIAYRQDLLDANFSERARGAVMYLTLGHIEHRFLRIEENKYRYAGQFFSPRGRPELTDEGQGIVDEVRRGFKGVKNDD